MIAPDPSEHEIQADICRYLTLHHIFWRRRAVAGRRKIRSGKRGEADLWILHKGVHYEVECKCRTGTQSREQIVFETDVTKAGGVYILARSVEDVRKVLFC